MLFTDERITASQMGKRKQQAVRDSGFNPKWGGAALPGPLHCMERQEEIQFPAFSAGLKRLGRLVLKGTRNQAVWFILSAVQFPSNRVQGLSVCNRTSRRTWRPWRIPSERTQAMWTYLGTGLWRISADRVQIKTAWRISTNTGTNVYFWLCRVNRMN